MPRLPGPKPRLSPLTPRLSAPRDEASRNRYRDSTEPHRAWYKTARWQRLRDTILLRDQWTCQMSGVLLRSGRSEKGVKKIAVETTGMPPASASEVFRAARTLLRPAVIDHLIPHHGDPSLFWDESNLWAVSADMHDTVCQAIEARLSGEAVRAEKLAYGMIGLDGYRTRPAGRWVDQRWG